MSKTRDFTEETIQLMYENVDEDPDIWFMGAGRWWDKVTDGWMGDPPPDTFGEDGRATKAYFEYILEFHDIHKEKLKELLNAVWDYESEASSKIKNLTSDDLRKLNLVLVNLKTAIDARDSMTGFSLLDTFSQMTASSGWDLDSSIEESIKTRAEERYLEAVDGIIDAVENKYGTDFKAILEEQFKDIDAYDDDFTFEDWLKTPEGIATIRLQAARLGIFLPLTKEQQTASQVIYAGITGDPVPDGNLLQPWPKYWNGENHTGIDIGASVGSDVVFTFGQIPGVTLINKYDSWTEAQGTSGMRSYGNFIQFQIPGIGPGGQPVKMTYAHLTGLDEGWTDIKIGTQVGPDSTFPTNIGLVGMTGNTSAPHLHFDVSVVGGSGFTCPYYYVNGSYLEDLVVDAPNKRPSLQAVELNEGGEIVFDQNGHPIITPEFADASSYYGG